jgi:hypothetical protein
VSGDESKRSKQAQAERSIIPDHHCWAQPDTQTTVSSGRRFRFSALRLLIINNDQGMTQAAPYLYGQLLVNNFGEWYVANF